MISRDVFQPHPCWNYVPARAVQRKKKRQPASQESLLPAWHFSVCNYFSKACGILHFLSWFLHPCKYVSPWFSCYFTSFLFIASHTNLFSAPEYNAIVSVCVSKEILWEIMCSSLLTMLAPVPFSQLAPAIIFGTFSVASFFYLWYVCLVLIHLHFNLIFPNAKEAI